MADTKKETSRVKITKRLIDSTERPESGQVFLRDLELLGFAVRFSAGATTFILEKRMKGRVRRLSIGPYGAITLDDARKKAKEMIGQIASGQDPAQDRLDKKRETTFGDLIEKYKERHLPRKKSGKNDELQINAHLEKWKNRKLSSIQRKDVARLHLAIGEKSGHYAANRIVSLLRKMFNLGHIWGFFNDENPATGIEFFQERKRERFVHPEELPKLIKGLEKEPNYFIRGALFTCLMTGQRKSEVLGMKWEDVDMEKGVWRIPETKPGRSHLVPLPGPVLELLQNLPHVHENPFVFVGRTNSHLTNINKAWSRIRTDAGLQDVRIHDLRRTVGSWLAGSGASLPLIGKVLNHSQPSTTAIYARLDLEPVRVALEANAQRMLIAIKAGEKKENEGTL
jgi:integrase